MSLVKLNHEETLLLSKKLQELNDLHQQVTTQDLIKKLNHNDKYRVHRTTGAE